ncbi:MAG: iron-sulfur cluster repair di-iron protein [Gemmatimonadales bacterium]|nr:iron-sulfur cluster repair di-iron protein [Gemmatimonadales bacterium]
MSAFKMTDTVGAVVARSPTLARVFEEAGIDYCCGGKKSVASACHEKGLDPLSFLDTLEDVALRATHEPDVDAATLTLAELADHIEQTHHAYLRAELPRLDRLSRKVAAAHGGRNPRLHELHDAVVALAAELSSHMLNEERILFPLVRQIEACGDEPMVEGGQLAHPIRQMELQHDQAGSALVRLRELTDGFLPPPWACNTYRALLDALASLERDTHQHIHKENNVLFLRALELERRVARDSPNVIAAVHGVRDVIAEAGETSGPEVAATMRIVSVIGRRNAGKTSLVVALAAELGRRGRSVMTIKHGTHPPDMDRPGKDTWRHWHEGNAQRVLMEAPGQRVLLERTAERSEDPVALARRYLGGADIVLVEGGTRASLPKIEVHRVASGSPVIFDPAVDDAAWWLVMLTDDIAYRAPFPVLRFSDQEWLTRVADLAWAGAARVPGRGTAAARAAARRRA